MSDTVFIAIVTAVTSIVSVAIPLIINGIVTTKKNKNEELREKKAKLTSLYIDWFCVVNQYLETKDDVNKEKILRYNNQIFLYCNDDVRNYILDFCRAMFERSVEINVLRITRDRVLEHIRKELKLSNKKLYF